MSNKLKGILDDEDDEDDFFSNARKTVKKSN